MVERKGKENRRGGKKNREADVRQWSTKKDMLSRTCNEKEKKKNQIY